MTKKTIIIYHKSDFDGIFCREIARKFLPDAELIGWDYGDPLPDIYKDTIPVDIDLYILDLSVPGLMDHPNLVWIDHHKSAIDKYPSSIAGYRIDGVAACRLAYQWFSLLKMTPNPEEIGLPDKEHYVDRKVVEPMAVRLAGEYDIWDKRDPNAELFQHGLRSRDLDDFCWRQLLDNSVDSALEGTGMEQTHSELIVSSLLQSGRSIQYFQERQNQSIITSYGFNVEWEGLVWLACNHARFNSHLFTAGLKPSHDACLGFNWTGKHWRVSLYHAPGKEHHDLSQIAVKHGGGGHKGACGFTCAQLPWNL